MPAGILRSWTIRRSTLLFPVIALIATGSPATGADDVIAMIARRLNWPVGESDIRQVNLAGLERCEIYDAYDKRVLDGVGASVTRLADGRLIVSSEAEASTAVIAGCVSPAAPAGTWAEMLVRFPNQSGLVVQHDRSDWLKRNLLAKAGKDFTPPEVVFDHGERVVRFLAVSSNGWALFSVEGRLGNDVSVKAEMLSHF